MVKNTISDLPPLLVFNYDLHKGIKYRGKAFNTLARQLGLSGGVVDRAYKEACSMQDKYERMLKSGQRPLNILEPKEPGMNY